MAKYFLTEEEKTAIRLWCAHRTHTQTEIAAYFGIPLGTLTHLLRQTTPDDAERQVIREREARAADVLALFAPLLAKREADKADTDSLIERMRAYTRSLGTK